jgi:hypothetical protein
MKGKALALSVLTAASCLPEAGSVGGDPDGDVSLADASPGAPDAQVSPPPDAAWMLNGTPPISPRPAPEFTVLNRDGTTRTRADLLGHPTVIWFYPAAYTGG